MRKHLIVQDNEVDQARTICEDHGEGPYNFAAPLVDKNDNAPTKAWGADWLDPPENVLQELRGLSSFQEFDGGDFDENARKAGYKKKPSDDI